MNSLAAIYFPETLVDQDISVALLTVFTKLFFYQPAEDDPDFTPNALFSAELCGLRVPAPLGEGRDNFLRFIKDVNGHESEYYGGWLSHLSSGLGQDKDEASVWSLIAALQGGKDGKTAQQEREANALWQARLVLKLASNLSRQEKEISHGLQDAAGHTQAMLRSLRGDDGLAEVGGELPFAGVELAPPSINVKHLLASWGQMYLRDGTAPQFVAVTASEQAAAEIFDVYEARTDRQPLELCIIDVPLLSVDETVDALTALSSFTARCAAEITAVRKLLMQSKSVAESIITDLTNELAQVVASYQQNMNKETGQVFGRIVFYLLPAVDLASIIKRLSVAPANSLPAAPPANTLIAVFKKK